MLRQAVIEALSPLFEEHLGRVEAAIHSGHKKLSETIQVVTDNQIAHDERFDCLEKKAGQTMGILGRIEKQLKETNRNIKELNDKLLLVLQLKTQEKRSAERVERVRRTGRRLKDRTPKKVQDQTTIFELLDSGVEVVLRKEAP